MKPNQKIHVGVVCREDPHDRKPQSGTIFQVFRALEQQEALDVFWIPFEDSFLSKAWLGMQKAVEKVLHIPMPQDRSPLYIRLKEKALNKALLNKADVLYCPFTQLVSVDKPTIYMSDALYHSMVNYYWKADPQSRKVRTGDKTQQMVLDHATKVSLPCQWAIDAALTFYHQPQGKVSLAEYGPNLDEADIVPHAWHYDGHLHVLFIGVDWVRKGGDKAVDACRWLNAHGIKCTLHIVGAPHLDAPTQALDFVDYIGFLNKNDKAQYEHFRALIAQCHCMLLPTQAECTGIAFCESTANGLPSFTHDTGGVPNYVLNGRNGYRLPLSANGRDFGIKIKECLENGELERMSNACLDVHRELLNWNTWAEKTAKVIIEVAVVHHHDTEA